MKRLTDREVLILELIFCGLPLVYYLLRLPFMPETVPVHWNLCRRCAAPLQRMALPLRLWRR